MDRKYIRQIIKRLKCSRRKKKEIKKQLEADILAAIENGETSENIKKRMGTTLEIAAEFNNNFSESEKKKHRKETRVKCLLLAGIFLLIIFAGIYWILPKTVEIGESHKEEVIEQTKYIIQLIGTGDYETLMECSNEKVKSVLKEKSLDEVKKGFGSDWGAFQSFGNIYMTEVQQMGNDFIIVQISTSYENASITYTLCFDKNIKLAGLYMK